MVCPVIILLGVEEKLPRAELDTLMDSILDLRSLDRVFYRSDTFHRGWSNDD